MKKTFRLLALVGALILLRTLVLEVPHWFPEVLGELPADETLRRGTFRAEVRLDQLSPALVARNDGHNMLLERFGDLPTVVRAAHDPLPRAQVHLGRLGVAVHMQDCILQPAASDLAYQVEVPPGAVFQASLAAWVDGEPEGRKVRMSVEVVSQGRPHRVLEQRIPLQSSPPETWMHRAILKAEKWLARGFRPKRWMFLRAGADLSEWSGRNVLLRFRVDPVNGEGESVVGIWGTPTVYGAVSGLPPNVVFFVIDGLSPAFTDCGKDRAWVDTPRLAEICKEGWSVRRAYAAANGTRASIAALAYGRFPSELGWGVYDREIPDRVRSIRRASERSMFEELAERGYATAGIHDNIFSLETHEAGYDLGLQENYVVHGAMQDTPNILRLAENWMADHRAVPFALYVHVDVTHDLKKIPPVTDLVSTLFRPPSSAFRAFRYAAGARYADRVLGRFEKSLAHEGLDDHTLLVVLSDHGNVFSAEKDVEFYRRASGRWNWNRAYGTHGASPFEDEIRILWVVRDPGSRGGEIRAFASFFDLRDDIRRRLGLDGAVKGHSAAESSGEGVKSATSLDRCARTEIQMGEVVVCADGTKRVRYEPGVEVKRDGVVEEVAEEFYRVDDNFGEERIEAGSELRSLFQARSGALIPVTARGWSLRVPAGREVAGMIQSAPTAGGRMLAVADELWGCRIMEVGTDRIHFEAHTVDEWCEIYLETPREEVKLEIVDEKGVEVREFALGPLGLFSPREVSSFSVREDGPALWAPNALPALHLTDKLSLYRTMRRTWAYAEQPVALSRQTPEVIRIMKEWGYLK